MEVRGMADNSFKEFDPMRSVYGKDRIQAKGPDHRLTLVSLTA